MGNVVFACRRYNLKTIKIHGRSTRSSDQSTTSNDSKTNTASSADFQEWLADPPSPDNKNNENVNKNKKEIYLEEGELGEGGFSTVLLATRVVKDKDNKTTQSQVAIKRIICSDPDQLESARNEIEITKKISSPYVIQLLSHGERRSSKNKNNRIVSLVFPVYAQGTLWDYLIKVKDTPVSSTGEGDEKTGKIKKLSSESKYELSSGILKGMKRIHMLNIAHCDLKTSNILLKSDLKTPVIMDFGSATNKPLKQIDSYNQSQTLTDWAAQNCTACYRAPELFDVNYPQEIDLRSSDVWSIGCCLRALIYFQGPLDEIWLKGDSLGLAVQSINKYIGSFEFDEGQNDDNDQNKNENEVYKILVEKSLLASSNQTRPSVDELLKVLESYKESGKIKDDL